MNTAFGIYNPFAKTVLSQKSEMSFHSWSTEPRGPRKKQKQASMCLSYSLSCRTIHPGPMQASLWVSRWFRWLAWSWINDVCSDSQLASNAAQRANPKQNRRTGTMAKILTTVFDSGWTVLKCCQKAPCKLIKQVLKLRYVFEVLYAPAQFQKYVLSLEANRTEQFLASSCFCRVCC